MWSTQVKKFLTRQTNSPRGLDYNCVGEDKQLLPCITNTSRMSDCSIRVYLLIDNNTIREARSICFCDPAGMASANWLIYKIKGKNVLAAQKEITPELMAKELEISQQSIQFSRCQSVHKAFSLAISNYSIFP